MPLPAESPGKLRKLNRWGTTSLASVSMGQEVSATSMQLVRACAAVANGGMLVKPKLIAEDRRKSRRRPKRRVRVLKPETAVTMRQMMEGVVLRAARRDSRSSWTDGRPAAKPEPRRSSIRHAPLHAPLQRVVYGLCAGERIRHWWRS